MTFFSLLSRRLMKDRRLAGQFVLVLLSAALVSFGLVFVHSMVEGIRERYVLLGEGDVTIEGEYTEGEVVIAAQALLYGKTDVRPLMIKGVRDSYLSGERGKALVRFRGEGRSAHGIILSEQTAKDCGLGIGDKVLAAFSLSGSLRPLLCTVDGLYASGYREMDEHLAFMQFDTLVPYGFLVQTELIGKEPVDQILNRIREQGYNARPWWEREDAVAENLVTSERVVTMMFIVVVLLCAYFVGEFASTLLWDHRADIALLHLMGAGKSVLKSACLTAIALVALLAIVLGMALGILVSYLLVPLLPLLADKNIPSLSYYLLQFRIEVPMARLLEIMFLLLGASMLSGMLALRPLSKTSVSNLAG